MTSKYKLNDRGDTSGVAQVAIFLTTSIIFSSICISWFLLQIYGVAVAGIPIPNPQSVSEINFVDSTGGVDNVLIKGGNWVYNAGIGRIATQDNSYLVFDNIALGVDNYYTNKYIINNSIKKDYSIILEYSSDRVIEVITKQDGLYVHDSGELLFGLITANDVFYPLAGANQITNAQITVLYSPTANPSAPTHQEYLIYTINGQTVISESWLNQKSITGITKLYYGGVGAKNAGLTITNFKTTNDKATADLTSFAYMIAYYASAIVKILVWNVDSQYLPMEINIIFIKSQLFGLGICIIVMMRG